MTTAAKPKAGLEDTVATSSAICYLDGDRGVLAYCGYDIHDLAAHATFEEVCYLLWHRRLPTRAELGDLQSQLIAARPLPDAVVRLMRTLPFGNAMDVLEASLVDIPRQLGVTPKAILVISGHWEERDFTLGTNLHPPMIYDYSGFPAHTYRVTYAALGSRAGGDL